MTPFDGEEAPEARLRAAAHIAHAWGSALQDLMGFPMSRSGGNRVVFFCGRLGPGFGSEDVRSLPARFDSDIVYLDFSGPIRDGPTDVMFATRRKGAVELFANCEAWRFKPWLKADLIASSHRIQVSADGRIKLTPNKLDEARARRVLLTRQAWLELAVEWAKDDLATWRYLSERGDTPPPIEGDDGGTRCSAPSLVDPAPNDGS